MNKLRTNPLGEVLLAGPGRSWTWYFSSRAMSSSTGNADTAPLLSVHLHHQLQENTFKRESQSPF